MRVFCFGYGYVAQRFASHAAAYLTRPVWGTQRLDADQDQGQGQDQDPNQNAVFAWHGHDLSSRGRAALAQATAVLISVPPDDRGCPVARQIDTLLPHAPDLQWIGYLSTTGVYGDARGGWVDETSPLHPRSPRSRHRVMAEQQWRAWGDQHAVPVQIFRLSGIYGPASDGDNRSPFDRIAAGDGRIIDAPGCVFNRVHVDDIAQTLLCGYRHGQSGVFNVSDDLPAEQSAVMQFAYDLMGLTPPAAVPLAQAALSPMAQEFYAETKRVCNEAIKRTLGVTLRYPTYTDGLSALYTARETQPSA